MKLRIASTLMTLAGILLMAAGSFAVPTPRPPSPVAAASKNLAEAGPSSSRQRKTWSRLERLAVNFEVKPEWKAAKEALEQAKVDRLAARQVLAALVRMMPHYKEQVEQAHQGAASTWMPALKRTSPRRTIMPQNYR